MKVSDKWIKLRDGCRMPAIGLGTWKMEGDQATSAIKVALDLGYRQIDTAAVYLNEAAVGRAVKNSNLPREDIFITTKLWKSDMGLVSTSKAFEKSLQKLQLDYVDLYLIHWPSSDAWQTSWKEMEKLQIRGVVRSIGVSNFTVKELQTLLNFAKIKPVVNQIELHPFNYLRQKPILDYCQQSDIAIQAYSPLSQTAWLNHEAILSLAESKNRSPAQVMLRWSIQHGAVPIPKAARTEHMKQNLQVFDFELTDEEMRRLDELSADKSILTAGRQGGWYLKNIIKRKVGRQ